MCAVSCSVRQAAAVGVVFALRDRLGSIRSGLPDPSGGTFDAAGDVDRLLDLDLDLPVLGSIDPFDETTLEGSVMRGLLQNIVNVRPVASEGPEVRGLRRVAVLAELCAADDRLVLICHGD